MMRSSRLCSRLAVLLLGAGALLAGLAAGPAASAAEDYQITAILPLTGNASFVGQAQQKALQTLEATVNEDGGLFDGRPLRFVFQDDQTSPQVAVQLTNSVLAENPSVVFGSSIVAMCNAMGPLLKNGPFDYCLSPAAHPAPGSYMFSTSTSTRDLLQALIRYFRLRGWTRLALLSSNDATGQDVENGVNELLALPENVDVKMVERARFNPGDISVTAQLEKIKAAEPQAFIAWTTGAPVAIIFKGIVQAGLTMPIGTTNGNMTFAQMEQYADFLPKQLYIPSSLFPEHDETHAYDVRVEAAQKRFYAQMKRAKLPIDNMAAHVWDPGMMVVAALRKLGPKATAEQLRETLASQTDFAGINGIYNFTKVPQRGLDVESCVITLWDPVGKHWVPVSEPAGTPLKK